MKLKAAGLAVAFMLVLGVVLIAQQQPTPPVKLPKTPAPPDAVCYIISPLDGETVGQTFTIRFGLRGMGVAPAGIPIENTGHHHLLIDEKALPPMDMPLPATDTIKHFGAGQTETELTLPPGKHTLQLVLGDMSHQPHDPPKVSKKITVTVK